MALAELPIYREYAHGPSVFRVYISKVSGLNRLIKKNSEPFLSVHRIFPNDNLELISTFCVSQSLPTSWYLNRTKKSSSLEEDKFFFVRLTLGGPFSSNKYNLRLQFSLYHSIGIMIRAPCRKFEKRLLNHTNCDFNQSLTNHNTVQFFKNVVIGCLICRRF